MARPNTATRRVNTLVLDAYIDDRAMTSDALASAAGISGGHLSDLRKGRRLASLVVATAIARELKLPTPEAILWPANAVERAA